jgi:hypothetical protein
MKLKEIIGKMTPEMFGRGESADAPLASLKEAWPKQRRNTTVMIIVGAAMLIASIVLAATVGGVPVIPCWVVFLVVAASLRVGKWNRRVKGSLQTLGLTRKDFKDVLRRLKREYKYIAPLKRVWFYVAMVLSLLLFMPAMTINEEFANVALWLFPIVCCMAYIAGIILCFRLRVKGVLLVAAASALSYIGLLITNMINEQYHIEMEDIFGFALISVLPLIPLLTIIPIIKEKRKIKNM